jgi:hypothetical protein
MFKRLEVFKWLMFEYGISIDDAFGFVKGKGCDNLLLLRGLF